MFNQSFLPKLLVEYLSGSSTMVRRNEEKTNTQTDYDTKRAFVNDDNFHPEEALKAAADKRKILMKRLYGNAHALLLRFNDSEYLTTRTTHSPKKRDPFKSNRAKSVT